jgi:hypothetical protein
VIDFELRQTGTRSEIGVVGRVSVINRISGELQIV